jgi:hypothetical protein
MAVQWARDDAMRILVRSGSSSDWGRAQESSDRDAAVNVIRQLDQQ